MCEQPREDTKWDVRIRPATQTVLFGRALKGPDHGRKYGNVTCHHAEAAADIGDYIVGFYNSTRLHSKLGYLLPNAFKRKKAAIRPIELS